MPIQLQLSTTQLADLATIRGIPPELLDSIAEQFDSAVPRPMRPKDLQQIITSKLKNKPDEANRILRPIIALQAIIRRRKIEPDEVVDAVRNELEASDWGDEKLKRWRAVEAAFKKLLTSEAVRLVGIALELTYEHENLLLSTRVVTDIRPIFSLNASKVEGAVVSHTLRIRYDSSEGDHSISLAMDERDIRELERQCNRALTKSQTARALMEDKAQVPTVASGDSNNAEG